MNLRVVSDGTAHGTRVETEDGELVHGIQSVTWAVSLNEPIAEVFLELRARVHLDVKAQLMEMRSPGIVGMPT